MKFILVENETGYLDGCYPNKKMATEAARVWDKRRPLYIHEVREVIKTFNCSFNDRNYLPFIHNNPEDRT